MRFHNKIHPQKLLFHEYINENRELFSLNMLALAVFTIYHNLC